MGFKLMESILQVNHLRKEYPGFALDNLSFSIPRGTITGFIGKNGAGKSTTLKCILGLIPSYTGEVELFGETSKLHSPAVNDRLGIVLDPERLYENIKVKEMNAILSDAYTQWSSNTCRAYLDQFGIDPNQTIGKLSSGMKKQLCIFYALSHNADFLILDEPTSGLDPYVRNQICSLFTDYTSGHDKSILFSTHITSDLEKTAEQLLILNSGKIVYNGRKDSLFAQNEEQATLEDCILPYLE